MTGKAKRRKVVDQKLRALLAANVQKRMDRMFSQSSNKPQALADKAGLWISRIQHVLKGESGVSIDIVGQIATALDCSAADLLSHSAETDAELQSLWEITDDLGKTAILTAARQWAEARPEAKQPLE